MITARRRAFIEAYLGAARCNGTKAARMAGYAKPSEEACRLLRNVQVQAAIAARRDEIVPPAEEILRVLADQMRGPDEECYTEQGLLDMRELKRRHQTHLVKKVTRNRAGISVELQAQQAAAKVLGQHRNLFQADGAVVVVQPKVYLFDPADGAPAAAEDSSDA